MSREVILRFFILLFVGIFIYSCGGAKKPQKVEKIFWPLPPEEPRILYLGSYHGESDFKGKSALDVLLGEPDKDIPRNLIKPYGVAGRFGKIFASDTVTAVVFVIDPKNKKVSFIGDKPMGKLRIPVGIEIDKEGYVYVSDAKQQRVFVYDLKGKLITTIGDPDGAGKLLRPAGIALNEKSGRLYVVDVLDHRVKVYSVKDGKFLFAFGKRGKKEGEFNFPTNIALDRRNGNIAVVDTMNFRVQIFNKDGEFVRTFGKLGVVPGSFARPKGVGIDSEGHIYVADAAFNNIQIFDDKGRLLLFIGKFGFSPGEFNLPAGLYVDRTDKLYVADSMNKRVQVFQYLSERWKKKYPEKYRELKTYKPPAKSKEDNKSEENQGQ
ncbi:6-bladed beta-propeller [Persephonella sp.]